MPFHEILTFISSFLWLCPVSVLSPSEPRSPWQVPSWSDSPQEIANFKFLLLSAFPFFLPFSVLFRFVSPREKQHVCVIVCVCVSSQLQRSWNSWVLRYRASVAELPLRLSLPALFFFFPFPRPGREEGKTVRGWDRRQKLLSANSFAVCSSIPCFPFLCCVSLLFRLTFALCLLACSLWQILFHCSARRESKALPVTLTPSSFF